jgi:DNA-directed RNA polymerase specialized sigma24 family protein
MLDGSSSVDQVTDAEIIRRIKASDHDGMRALLARHGPTVLAFLVKRHGHHVAAEALNRASLIVWLHAITKYDESRKGSLCGWFMRIAQNKAIDIRRRESRKSFAKLEFDTSYDPSESVPQQYETPDQTKEREQRDGALNGFISKLPRVQQTITLVDMADSSGEADVETIRDALANPAASQGSIYTARCKARAAVKAEMLRLGYYS